MRPSGTRAADASPGPVKLARTSRPSAATGINSCSPVGPGGLHRLPERKVINEARQQRAPAGRGQHAARNKRRSVDMPLALTRAACYAAVSSLAGSRLIDRSASAALHRPSGRAAASSAIRRASPISPSPRRGSVFLLRNDRAAGALHGQPAAAARPCRACRRVRRRSAARSKASFGPLSTQALASQIFGLYAGFVYFTPVLGGWVADRWIGQRNAVVLGALSMSRRPSSPWPSTRASCSRCCCWSSARAAQGQHLGPGRRPLSGRRGSAPDARLRHLQHGDQFRRGAGPLVCGFLGSATAGTSASALAALFMLGGARHLSQRLSPSAGQGRAEDARRRADDARTTGRSSRRSSP